jgi:LmbE family N-acetylglucosaminyl deacetylase
VRRLSFSDQGAGDLRVLAIGAHPDDIEIGCGGTVLRLVADDLVASVRWVVCSGEAARADEARAGAAAMLAGVTDHEVIVGGGRDGYFPLAGADIKDRFEDLKRGPEPDLILTHRRDDRHQDHRFISDLTWQTFRSSLILEYEIPKYDGDLGDPNVFVEIPESIVRKKIDILETSFTSQLDRHWYDAETFRAIMRIRGIESRSPSGYAEGFEGRKLIV